MEKTKPLIDKFVSDLEAIIREDIQARITAAFGTAPAAKAPAKAPAKSEDRKRSAETILKQAARLLQLITDNPEISAEKLAAAMKLPTTALALPLKKLIAEKKIKAAGVARGTKYSVVK